MQHHHVQQSLSQPASLLLACLVNEPKTATAWYEAVVQATEQVRSRAWWLAWNGVAGLKR